MVRQTQVASRNIRRFTLLAIALIAFYVIIPQIGSFRDSVPILMQAHARDIWLAFGCTVLTYVAGAGTYCWLAMRHLRYGRTLLIQVAGMFVNRLLPAGIGSIGVNYAYLRKERHSQPQAASVVAVNNALGIIGHVFLLMLLLVIYHQAIPPLQLGRVPDAMIIGVTVVIVLILWVIFYRLYGQRFWQAIQSFGKQLLLYRQRPRRLALALACSMSLTLSNVLAFWFCVAAMGGGLSFITVFLVFTFGIALGTATPTPGGLGGVEAGLITGLVVYHVDGATALAIVLLYRLLTYWLPLLAGGGAFVYSQRRRYF